MLFNVKASLSVELTLLFVAASYVALPFSVVIFCIGFFWGVFMESYHGGAALDIGAESVTEMDPHLLLLIFIPPLLFESGFLFTLFLFYLTVNDRLSLTLTMVFQSFVIRCWSPCSIISI